MKKAIGVLLFLAIAVGLWLGLKPEEGTSEISGGPAPEVRRESTEPVVLKHENHPVDAGPSLVEVVSVVDAGQPPPQQPLSIALSTPKTESEATAQKKLERFFDEAQPTSEQRRQILRIFYDVSLNQSAALQDDLKERRVGGKARSVDGGWAFAEADELQTQEGLRQVQAVLSAEQFLSFKRHVGVMITFYAAALRYVDASGKPMPLPSNVAQ